MLHTFERSIGDRSFRNLFLDSRAIAQRIQVSGWIVDPLDWQQVETKKKGVRAFGKKKKKRNLVFKTEKKK